MRRFAEHCLSRAGHLMGTESIRRYHKKIEEHEAKRKAAKDADLPWESFADSSSSNSLFESSPTEKHSFPQMTESEFRVAWNLDGKQMRELSRIIAIHEQTCVWDSEGHYQTVTKKPLPIKAVMQRELHILQHQFELEGRMKTVGGKQRNGARYLSDVERELKQIVRELVGLEEAEDY